MMSSARSALGVLNRPERLVSEALLLEGMLAGEWSTNEKCLVREDAGGAHTGCVRALAVSERMLLSGPCDEAIGVWRLEGA